MSDQLRTGTAVGTASAAGGARATLHTGRCIDGRDECYNRVPAWAQLKDRASIESYPLNDDLKAVLARARLCDEDQLMCYRGRRIPFWKPSPAASNMGPPPLGSKGTDRYNYDGQVVLYLTRSIDRIAEEVCPHPWERVWVQSYTLKPDGLCIADFCSTAEPLLNHVFWRCETARKERGTGFLFSQFVAGLVAALFDGMIVPGVRESARYDNVVVFRPHERWRDWLTDGCDPQRLSDRTCVRRAPV